MKMLAHILIRTILIFVVLYLTISSIKKRLPILVLGYFLILLGGLSNNIVVFANGIKMPAMLPEGYAIDPNNNKHTIMTENTKLWFLGDIFIISFTDDKKAIASIGDIFLATGTVALIFCLFLYPVKKKKTEPHITHSYMLQDDFSYASAPYVLRAKLRDGPRKL